MAVAFAVVAVLTYIAGLMCSHLAAFRIATNLRLAMVKHIATLPLGAIEQFGSGKLRRTISETAGSAETYLAHQLPDQAKAMATIAGLLTLLLAFDWRLGLLSLVPVALAFAVMTSMTGKKMQEQMNQYQNALADMSGEAVEYVRGIPVVKTFGQTVFSFKKFKGTIDNYERWVIAYTKQLRWPMIFYTLAVNSVFMFLIAGAFLFASGGTDGGALLNLFFYIIITPVISLTLTKLMFMSENGMIVQDAITHIDRVLESPSLSCSNAPKHPKDSSVALDHVTFSYDGVKNALEDISLSIGTGQTVAFVGPSGGGKSTLAALIARFFDPQSGKISIGGVNVKDIDKSELMETVVLLSKGEVDSKKIRVEFSLEDMDMSEFQDGATYPQIKEYVLEHTGLKVSNLYISQIKRKCGIGVGKNYNLPKSEDSRQPQCPQEKEKAIREAFKYFGMI